MPAIAIWDFAGDHAAEVHESPAESARFGLNVARLNVGRQGRPDDQIASTVQDARADLVIVRYPSDRTGLARALATGPRTTWHADTLLYFHTHLGGGRPTLSTAGTAARLERWGVGQELAAASLVGSVFSGYPNHYTTNPLIQPSLVVDGYAEWASRLAASPTGAFLVLIRDGAANAIAFAALQFKGSIAEVSLAGVHPDERGRGVYAHLLLRVQEWLIDRGFLEFVISTQTWNVVPIRHWIAVGLQFRLAINTVHSVSEQAWGRMGHSPGSG